MENKNLISKLGSSASEVRPVHSRTGASSMHRWEQCSGSVRLSATVPPSTSVYAEEGTRAHEVAAAILQGEWIQEPSEMLEAVLVYTHFVNCLVEEAKDHWKSFIRVEQRFDLSHFYPGVYGTSDAVIYNGHTETLYIIDYKHGQGVPVEVEDNEQLLYYAFGAVRTLGINPKKIVMGIVQPRCHHDNGPIRTQEIHPLDLLDFEVRLIRAIKATEDPDAPLRSGDHCQFCPAKGICPELRRVALETARQEFTDPANYDQNKLVEVLKRLPALEAFVSGVRSFAYEEALRGRTPPGFKLVQKRAFRKWRSEEVATKTLISDFKLSEADILEVSLVSPARVGKLLSKDEKQMLANLTFAESSGLVLAPASDKRPEVKNDPLADFEMIEDQTTNQEKE